MPDIKRDWERGLKDLFSRFMYFYFSSFNHFNCTLLNVYYALSS